jgi:hypothetical protein
VSRARLKALRNPQKQNKRKTERSHKGTLIPELRQKHSE